jgi:hypothetical protein
MIKKKYFLYEMEVKNEQGEVKKPDLCFADESYIIVKIPSYKDKLSMKDKVSQGENSALANLEMIESLVDTIHCIPLDDNENVVKTFDDLTCYCDSEVIIAWLSELIARGFVPKKLQTV